MAKSFLEVLYLVRPPNKHMEFFLARKTTGEAIAVAEKYYRKKWFEEMKAEGYRVVKIEVREI